MLHLFPYIITITAISCYALLSPMAKKIGESLPPFTFISASSFILFMTAGIIAYIFEKQAVLNVYDKVHWNWLLIFSITNLIGYALYLLALSKIPVAQYQMFSILSPIIGGIFAAALLKEPFHIRYILSLVFICIGLYIAVKPEILKK